METKIGCYGLTQRKRLLSAIQSAKVSPGPLLIALTVPAALFCVPISSVDEYQLSGEHNI